MRYFGYEKDIMKKLLLILLGVLSIFVQSPPALLQENAEDCDQQTVIDWIHRRYEFEQQLEAADTELSNNLTDIRRIPRVDLLVEVQNIRRAFEWLQPPPCARELQFLTSLYWTQRIDMLTISLAENKRRNTQEDLTVFYQDILLPAIYKLEAEANIDYFAEIEQERPADAPANIEVGEVVINNAALEKVIAVEPITLPNCNGSSELEISREFTKSTERNITHHAGAGGSALVGVVQVYLETYASLSENNTLTESLEVEMRAAPGSTVTYEIEWVEVSISGILEVIQNDTVHFVEFSIPERLRANIRQPIQTPCESV